MEKDNTIEVAPILSPVIIEHVHGDKCLQALQSELSKLWKTAVPIIIKVSEREFKACYSDEFNRAAEYLQLQIDARLNQIVGFYNR